MDLNQVFENFCNKLSQRKGKMTEDNVRYYWFAQMYDEDPELNHYMLEAPYIKLQDKELDLKYFNGKEQWAMEMKFHRYSENSDLPHTDAAGDLFNDILRLQYAPVEAEIPTRRLFLYVTDNEMDAYLSKEDCKIWQNLTFRRELRRFYTMCENTTSVFRFKENETNAKDTIPSTFTKSALDSIDADKKEFSTPQICLLRSKKLSNMNRESFKDAECHIRLYEIIMK